MTFSGGLERLFNLRRVIYEHLNQLQHEGLLLDAIGWLTKEQLVPINALWSWHPRQTSGIGEPDLKAAHNGQVLVCAEATAAAIPKGTILKRLKLVLERLPTTCPANAYYCFVRTSEMEQAAMKIVRHQRLRIVVTRLPFTALRRR
jgi:hypothetical protein